ncbi:MAG: sigma-70 family RNA polymerase sigma factor [bacterium]
MLKFKEGDVACFEKLLDKYETPLLNMIYRLIGDRREAEELAQEVFLRVYKSASRYEVRAKFSTWLYRIATNLCLNELRKKGQMRIESLDTPVSTEEGEVNREIEDGRRASPPELMEQKEQQAIVREAINSLPENQRIAVILNRYEELSYEEMAHCLNLSVSAVKSLLHRAKESLKVRLMPYM